MRRTAARPRRTPTAPRAGRTRASGCRPSRSSCARRPGATSHSTASCGRRWAPAVPARIPYARVLRRAAPALHRPGAPLPGLEPRCSSRCFAFASESIDTRRTRSIADTNGHAESAGRADDLVVAGRRPQHQARRPSGVDGHSEEADCALQQPSRSRKVEQMLAGALRYGPYAMFALLPAFALLLKLVYAGRRKRHPRRPRLYARAPGVRRPRSRVPVRRGDASVASCRPAVARQRSRSGCWSTWRGRRAPSTADRGSAIAARGCHARRRVFDPVQPSSRSAC